VARLEARSFRERAAPDSPLPVGSRLVQIQPAAMRAVS